MHPFLSYEMAKGIVEEKRVGSEQRSRWRRIQEDVAASALSWDRAVIELMATDAAGDQE